MVPWYFAYDRVNYSRYLPAYLSEMEDLPNSHPLIYADLNDGNFVVHRQAQHGFSGIACDQTIEQTFNRDSKTKGGITGITMNKSAVNRWILSHHERAAISSVCKVMAGQAGRERSRKDLDQAAITRDSSAVSNITNTIEIMTDPFTFEGEYLINISSGVVAPNDVRDDLLQAYTLGKSVCDKFYKERISGSEVDLFTPIRSQRLKTFANTGKKLITKLKSETMVLKSNSELFSRLLIVGKTRDLDLRLLLSYSLTSVPSSLGTYDGLNVKTAKCTLMHELETSAAEVEMVPENCALMVDGMALIQILHDVPKTFGTLAQLLLERLLALGKQYQCKRIDFVVDTYPSISIKNCERSRRAVTGVQVLQITRSDQKTPKQFKKFLSSGVNKEQLVDFLFASWQNCDPEVLNDIELYICHRAFCHIIHTVHGKVVTTDVPELTCNHEEADTRLLLHSKHASTAYRNLIISTPDTDVMVLAIAFSREISAALFLLTGVGNNRRIINISDIATACGTAKCQALIGLHVFTGCDSVSAFKGKGKVKALKLLDKSEELLETFQKLGQDWSVTEDIMAGLETFVCLLYGQKKCNDVNEARYAIFRLRCKSDAGLPPNKDCLLKHAMRASYQAAIHQRSLEQIIDAPSPVGHGWKLEDGELVFDWMSQPPAPPSVLQDIKCNCRQNGCSSNRCSCQKANLPCTELCNCCDCLNASNKGMDDDEDDGEFDSEEEN